MVRILLLSSPLRPSYRSRLTVPATCGPICRIDFRYEATSVLQVRNADAPQVFSWDRAKIVPGGGVRTYDLECAAIHHKPVLRQGAGFPDACSVLFQDRPLLVVSKEEPLPTGFQFPQHLSGEPHSLRFGTRYKDEQFSFFALNDRCTKTRSACSRRHVLCAKPGFLRNITRSRRRKCSQWRGCGRYYCLKIFVRF
jgi:hypothetical protein